MKKLQTVLLALLGITLLNLSACRWDQAPNNAPDQNNSTSETPAPQVLGCSSEALQGELLCQFRETRAELTTTINGNTTSVYLERDFDSKGRVTEERVYSASNPDAPAQRKHIEYDATTGLSSKEEVEFDNDGDQQPNKKTILETHYLDGKISEQTYQELKLPDNIVTYEWTQQWDYSTPGLIKKSKIDSAQQATYEAEELDPQQQVKKRSTLSFSLGSPNTKDFTETYLYYITPDKLDSEYSIYSKVKLVNGTWVHELTGGRDVKNTYNENGLQTQSTDETTDAFSNPTNRTTILSTYDDKGRLITQTTQINKDADDTIDLNSQKQLQYDEFNNLVSEQVNGTNFTGELKHQYQRLYEILGVSEPQ